MIEMKIKKCSPIIFAVLVVFMFSACGIAPTIDLSTQINSRPGKGEHVSRAEKNIPCTQPIFNGSCPPEEPDVFIGVAISGGGSRAAVFSNAVLERLEELGILPSVTAISSVSGGSVSAAYYSLYRKQKGDTFWRNAENELSQDFISRLILKSLNPFGIGFTSVTSKSRTNLMADVFDEMLFNGATYANLGQMSYGNPMLYINATAINFPDYVNTSLLTRGANASTFSHQGFTFWDDAFRGVLNSSLSNVKLSDAVMASAAFPGVFNSIQVAQYIDSYGKDSSKPGSYVHLIDGGASDNLGIDALITAAAGHEFSLNRAKSENKNRCLLIVVDSHIGNSTPLNNKLYDGRTGFSDHFVDSNYSDAFDALLLRRREEQLRDLGIEIGYEKKSSRKVRFFPDSKINLRNFSFQRIGNTSYLGPDSNDNVTEMHCAIWHVALDNAVADAPEAIKISKGKADGQVGKKIPIQALTRQIDTNFVLKAKHPGKCSQDVIRKSLVEASKIVVINDVEERMKVCEWLRSRQIDVSNNCFDNKKIAVSDFVPGEVMKPAFGYERNGWVECSEQ